MQIQQKYFYLLCLYNINFATCFNKIELCLGANVFAMWTVLLRFHYDEELRVRTVAADISVRLQRMLYKLFISFVRAVKLM